MVRFGGPGRDRTDDLFHAMEARSQLRHRPILGDTRGCPSRTAFIILADLAEIVNARESPGCPEIINHEGHEVARRKSVVRRFLPFLPQAFSAIIDRAPHLHHFSKTI